MEDVQSLLVFIMLSIFSVTGTIGNSLVLYIYAKKRDRTTSSIFILSLAGTDLITCVVIIPYNIAVLYLDYRLEFDFVCKLYMFLITCNVPFSAFIMVAIAFDRYFCICHPFLHAINIPRSKVIVLLMALFAFTLGIITALMFGVETMIPLENSQQNVTHAEEIVEANTSYFFNKTFPPNFTVNKEYNVSAPLVNYEEATVGNCMLVPSVFSIGFVKIYQKLYAGLYLLSFLIVLVLYGLIYRAIHVRRAQKAKRKRSSLFPVAEISMNETQLTALNNGHHEDEMDNTPGKTFKRKSTGIKDKTFYANIRTAAMLFIVTIVFLFAFLPAWLMAHRLIDYYPIVFYMYFIYNVVNPVIYAFMNMSFRQDLRLLFTKLCT